MEQFIGCDAHKKFSVFVAVNEKGHAGEARVTVTYRAFIPSARSWGATAPHNQLQRLDGAHSATRPFGTRAGRGTTERYLGEFATRVALIFLPDAGTLVGACRRRLREAFGIR
jgi:hypothetical protein